jgi:hypothetical protein
MADTVSGAALHPERKREMHIRVIMVNRMGKLYNNQRGLQIPLASLYGDKEASGTNPDKITFACSSLSRSASCWSLLLRY